MRWRFRLHPARALLWILARLYRTKDEQLGRMLIDFGRLYLRRPDEHQ
jgi:hypothetical protein